MSRRFFTLPLLLFAFAVTAGAVTAGAGPALAAGRGNQCLLSSNTVDFTAPDDHTVYVRVGVNQVWKLDLINDCLELSYRLDIGIEPTGGDPWICEPVQATVVNHGAAIPHHCPVRKMRLLTPEEVAALPRGVAP